MAQHVLALAQCARSALNDIRQSVVHLTVDLLLAGNNDRIRRHGVVRAVAMGKVRVARNKGEQIKTGMLPAVSAQ